MTTFYDLRDFFKRLGYNIIIAADGEPRMHVQKGNELVLQNPAGGVSAALDSVARASNAVYITRGRTEDDKKAVDKSGKVVIKHPDGDYTIKRLFFTEQELAAHYFGYSNQTLWPLAHAAFERPEMNKEWYEGYKAVNKKYAKAIKEEIKGGKTFVWIHDYQLALVPLYLGKMKNVTIGFFWHIPWPTWEIFRVLPEKRDLLWSLLSCDYIAFHRSYQARNFIDTVRRELEVRVDEERRRVHFDKNVLSVQNLPIGIDVDVIQSVVSPKDSFFLSIVRNLVRTEPDVEAEEKKDKKKDPLDILFNKYKVILGVDRLDYTKGIPQRLRSIDTFLQKYPQYQEKVVYVGIMSPSRDSIPSYQALRKEVDQLGREINKKYSRNGWKPLQLVNESYTREDVMNLYKKSAVCLVTPLDDGMNLVSKEFVIAADQAEDPGMLVLSQFAGSALDLAQSLVINPYDIENVARAIKRALEMSPKEKKARLKDMVELMEDRNIYDWAQRFVKQAVNAVKENRIAS